MRKMSITDFDSTATLAHILRTTEITSFSDPESNVAAQRIKNYREVHHTTLLESKRAVECLMLIEMMGEAESMEDIKLVYEYAMRTIYPSLSS